MFTSSGKSQITIVGCVSASGHCIPPMVIWDRKTLNPELANGEIPGTIYGLSRNGWMDMELFDIWFRRHFLRYCPSARPILLLMDGHSSHYCLDTISQAAEEEVILFVLPPNTTHLTQPLDKGIFGPLKVCWREICYRYLSAHPGCVITRYEFSQLFSEAWMQTMSMKNISAGFSTTGVFPVNRDALTLPLASESTDKLSKLSYIPMYTPSKCRPSSVPVFSKQELSLFESCYDDGYDLSKDARYQKWLQIYHPDDPLCSADNTSDYQSSQHQSCLKKFFDYPSPPQRRCGITEETSARVLTSSQNLQCLEEKKQKKEQNEKLKQERIKKKKLKQEMKRAKDAASTRGMHITIATLAENVTNDLCL